MKELFILGILLFCVCVQHFKLMDAQNRITELTHELDVAHATQHADRETFQQQIKIIREASKHADTAHKNLANKSELSDADWLADVLGSMWSKDANGGAVSTGVDAGAMSGTAGNTGTATGKDPAAVQRGNDAQGN